MRTFTRVILTLALLVGALSFAAPASATDTTTTGPCTTDYHPTWRATKDVGDMTYSEATTVIQAIRGCNSDPDGNESASVVAANLQSASCLLQIGYHADNDGIRKYFATVDDGSLGDGEVTDMSIGFAPVVNSTDWFRIYKSGTNWVLRVDSSAAGTYAYRTIPVSHCVSSFDFVWWGLENENNGDRLGGHGSANEVKLTYLGYKSVQDSTLRWMYPNPGPLPGWDLHGGGPTPACWQEGWDPGLSGTLVITGYTEVC